MTELVLGIDIGTASTKGVLATPDGTVIARASRDHEVSLPRPGWVEHDPEAAWWGDVVAICRELASGRQDAISCVGVSGIGPCVAPCDANDLPLRPAILYGVDTRAEDEVAELTSRLGDAEILRVCGSALSSQALGPKLLWLSRNEPDVWAQTRRWHMASTFAVARLTGEWVLDHSSASQCDPLYDLKRCTWHEPWASTIVPGLVLPPLAWPGEVVGSVIPAAARATGLRAGTPVIAGTIDAWAEALSVGVRGPGSLMMMYGSTMFLVAATRDVSTQPSMWSTRGIDPGSYTVAAGMATSGSLTAWIRQLVGSPSFETLLSEADAAPVGASGLILLPYFQGERTPIFDPRARGTIVGLTIGHSRGDLYRASLEGIAFAVRHTLEEMGATPSRTVAVGGGVRDNLWPQIVSDVCGLAQDIPLETIGASYGDALLAAEAVELIPTGSTWAQPAEIVTPDANNKTLYDDLYRLYRDLHPATRSTQHALAELQIGGSDSLK